MINCVGGLLVLFPILEQLPAFTPEQQQQQVGGDPTPGSDFITPDVTTPAEGDWVILPSNRASGLPQTHIYVYMYVCVWVCLCIHTYM